MNSYKKIIYLLAMLIQVFAISACTTSDLITDTNITANDPQTGFVAFSSSCTGTFTQIILQYGEASSAKDFSRMLVSKSNFQVLPCGANSTEYFLLQLPADSWTIYGFSVGDEVTPTTLKQYKFDIKPGKVTYLGRVNIDIAPNKNLYPADESEKVPFRYKITDNLAEDLPVFLNKFHHISRDKYIIDQNQD